MKKLLTCCILSIALATALIGCSVSNTNTPANTGEEVTPNPPKDQSKSDETAAEPEKSVKPKEEVPADDGKIDFEGDSGKLVYTKHEIIKDYEDKPAIVIYFDYTNLSDKSSTSMFSFSITPFQNGVECENAIITSGIKEIDNNMKEVKKDVTLPVAFAFVLEDNKGDVELEVSDLFSLDDTTDTQTLKIK